MMDFWREIAECSRGIDPIFSGLCGGVLSAFNSFSAYFTLSFRSRYLCNSAGVILSPLSRFAFNFLYSLLSGGVSPGNSLTYFSGLGNCSSLLRSRCCWGESGRPLYNSSLRNSSMLICSGVMYGKQLNLFCRANSMSSC